MVYVVLLLGVVCGLFLIFFFFFFFFFFNDTATTEIYTLSLHYALPILAITWSASSWRPCVTSQRGLSDRKSTRLNSSHRCISYAVFCLKKKKKKNTTHFKKKKKKYKDKNRIKKKNKKQ